MKSREVEKEKLFANFFKALAHPVRLSIVRKLADGEVCVCDLKGKIGVDLPTISKHLSVMRKTGLVIYEKRGLWVFYKLEDPKVFQVLDLVEGMILQQARRQLELVDG